MHFRIFPKITKCSFQTYGASGTIQTHDGLCVLPINVLNEKIVLFLWIWLAVLGVTTAANSIVRVATLASVRFRKLVIFFQW